MRKWKTTNRMRYRYGSIITANMYLGLRIGELLALKWKDVHFSDNYILVDKTLVQIKNPDYDAKNELEEYYRVRNGVTVCDRAYLPDLKKAAA